MNRQMEDMKITAWYSRLSRDDEQIGVSGLIVNQKIMLEDYAAKTALKIFATSRMMVSAAQPLSAKVVEP